MDIDFRICKICGENKPLTDQYYRKSLYTNKAGIVLQSFFKICTVCFNLNQNIKYQNNKGKEKVARNKDGHRICKVCGENKLLNNIYFPSYKRKNKIYFLHICKECKAIKQHLYFLENKESLLQKIKEYEDKNPDKVQKWQEKYYLNNKPKVLLRNKKWRDENKDKCKEYQNKQKEKDPEYGSNYRKQNKETLNKKLAERRKNDLVFKLRGIVSNTILRMLKICNGSKSGQSCLNFLDYSIEDLKKHLESKFEPWMNWDNHGNYLKKTWDNNNSNTWKWQIDHIIPQSDLPYTSMEDDNFKKCWALENLRPYSAKQNYLDGVSKVRHKKDKQSE